MFKTNLIKLILIIVLIGLISYLWIDSNSLSCNKCVVTFKEKYNPAGTTYNMSDLFNQTQTKDCPIYWDRVQGYVKGG
jgi:hypothetical protein